MTKSKIHPGETLWLVVIFALLTGPLSGGWAIPPDRRQAVPPNYCRRLLWSGVSLAAVGLGLVWSEFSTAPPQPLELSQADTSAVVGADRAAGAEWEAVLSSGRAIEGTIPRTPKGMRAIPLFEKNATHRVLADLARMQLSKDRPDLSLGKAPGVQIPLDRLDIVAEANGDIFLRFISPLGELRSQNPLPRDLIFSGAAVNVTMSPLVLPGDAGASATVEAALRLKLDAPNGLILIEETVIRVEVTIPGLRIKQSDEARVKGLTAVLAPSK